MGPGGSGPSSQYAVVSGVVFLFYFFNENFRIMRPNTAHAVFTPDNVICHGGHFYASSTMQDTMFGIVHTFMSHMCSPTQTSQHMALSCVALLHFIMMSSSRSDWRKTVSA
jgi:hypothetical protein